MGNTYGNVHLDYDEWNAAGLDGPSVTGAALPIDARGAF
jgi:hypothetical protein